MRSLPTHILAATFAAFIALASSSAGASEIGVTPVAVHLDPLNNRASVSVVNSGSEPVILQAEAVEWKHAKGVDQEDAPTADMVINPSVFTVQPGQSQLVRVGLRRAAQSQHEGTYRIVMREVPAAPRPGEVRISGQVQVLMALRVPIYVAPTNVVRDSHWVAEQAVDGTVTASLSNEGNVHVRVGRLQLRSADGDTMHADQAVAAVVFPGEAKSFRLSSKAFSAMRPQVLEVTTDQGVLNVPVAVAQR